MNSQQGAVLQWWPEGERHGVELAVSTRHGGVSDGPYSTLNLGLHVSDEAAHVVANRERAATAFGVGLESLVFAEQVHGARAVEVGVSERGRGALTMDDAVPACDILLTTATDVTLIMLVADCVPIALIDREAGLLAVVHAGWRGTAAGALIRAIEAMQERGAQPSRMIAYLGPAVEQDRYQVDRSVIEGLAAAVSPAPLAPGIAQDDGPDHWKVDLVAANEQQLGGAGLAAKHIFTSGTTTTDEAYFSDRAERPCGRFALMARLLG